MIAEYDAPRSWSAAAGASSTPPAMARSTSSAAPPTATATSASTKAAALAPYQVVAEEVRVVRKIFEWVGQERCSIGEVCRRLRRDGVPTRTGKAAWDRSVIWSYLKNPAYKGTAGFGKQCAGDLKPRGGAPGRPPRAAPPPRLSGRYIIGGADLHRSPRPGGRGSLRVGPGPTRGEPAPPSRAAPWRPLSPPGPGRLQAVRLRLLRQADEPGRGQGEGPLRLLPLHGLRRLPLRRPATVLEQAGPHRCPGRRRLGGRASACPSPSGSGRSTSGGLQRPETGAGREVKHLSNMINNVKKMISRLIDAYGEGLLDKSEFEPRIVAARERWPSWRSSAASGWTRPPGRRNCGW